MFRHNVGGVDRVLRLTLGGIFFFAGLFLLTSSIRPGVVLAVIGILALLTGIFQPLRNQACDCVVWMKQM